QAAVPAPRPRPRPLRHHRARERSSAAGARPARARRAVRHPRSVEAGPGGERGRVSERALLSPLMLSSSQVEALRQLAGLASTDAARSLGRLLGTSVDADLPRAQVAPRGAVVRVLQPECPSFAVQSTPAGRARLPWLPHCTEQGPPWMA